MRFRPVKGNAALAELTTALRNAERFQPPSRLASRPALLHPVPVRFQNYSARFRPGSGLLGSHLRIVNSRSLGNKGRFTKSLKNEERKSDDGRFQGGFIAKEERAVGKCSWRRDCRDSGPATGLHPLWMAHSAGDRRRATGRGGVPRRRWHLYSGSMPALLYSVLGGGHVLRCQPQAAFLDGASAGLRLILWGRGRRGNESRRFAPVG